MPTPTLTCWPQPWLIAGDWNIDVNELIPTSLAESVKGEFVFVDSPSMHDGPNELDFGLASRKLSPLLSVTHDWDVPHKPHAALQFSIDAWDLKLQYPQMPDMSPTYK